MKKLLLATALLTLSITASAAQFPGVIALSRGYAASYTSVTVAANLDAGETAGFAPYANNTTVFCGITGISSGDLMKYGYRVTFFTAPKDDLYLVLCFKTAGISEDVIIALAEPSFYGIQVRSAEAELVDAAHIEKMQEAMDEFLR